jgi:hypothetical protein
MKHLALVILTLFSATALSNQDELQKIQGHWILDSTVGFSLQDSCKAISINVQPDKIMGKSGELEFEAAVKFHKYKAGYIFEQQMTKHNNQPNCQGRPAEHVKKHFASVMYYEIHGNELREYYFKKEDNKYLKYLKVNP